MFVRNVDMAGFVASADVAARTRQAADPNQQRLDAQVAAAHLEKRHEEQSTRVEEQDESNGIKRRLEDEEQGQPGTYDEQGRRDDDDEDEADEHPHINLVA